MARLGARLQDFAHGDEFNGFIGANVEVHLSATDVAASGIQLNAGESRHQLNGGIAARACLLLAMIEQ
jgi:hypothetical protein